jgi:hypothetical protein
MVNCDDIEKWIDTSCDDGWDPAKDGWDLESDEDQIAPPLIVGHKAVDRVRLAAASDRWPDGYVQIGQRTENVEVTIALTAGRKLADEYKPGPNKPHWTRSTIGSSERRAFPLRLKRRSRKNLRRDTVAVVVSWCISTSTSTRYVNAKPNERSPPPREILR